MRLRLPSELMQLVFRDIEQTISEGALSEVEQAVLDEIAKKSQWLTLVAGRGALAIPIPRVSPVHLQPSFTASGAFDVPHCYAELPELPTTLEQCKFHAETQNGQVVADTVAKAVAVTVSADNSPSNYTAVGGKKGHVTEIMSEERIEKELKKDAEDFEAVGMVKKHDKNDYKKKKEAKADGRNEESSAETNALLSPQAHNGLPPAKKQELTDQMTQIFQQLDGDNSGCLAREELRAALEAVGLSSARTMKLLRIADADGSGEINLEEWIKAVESGANKEMRQSLAKLLEKQKSDGGIFAEDKDSPKPKYDACMLHPRGAFRITWDVTTALFLLYVAMVSPFTIAFGKSFSESDQHTVEIIETVLDCGFMIDVLLNFRTGIYAYDGSLVMTWRTVGWHYLHTWFPIDFLSSVPFDRVLSIDTQFMKLAKMGKIGRVFHLFVPRSSESFSKLVDIYQDYTSSFSQRCIRRCGILVSTILLGHWLACAMKMSGDGYLSDYQDVQHDVGKEYLAALYWSMTTLTTVGYGDITPGSDSERLCAMLAMVVGGGFYGYVIGTISVVVATRDLNEAAYYDRMDLVSAWIDYHHFPRELRLVIRRYFREYLSAKSAVSESEIYDDLSPALREDVCKYLIKDEVIHNPLFDGLPISTIVRIQRILHCVVWDGGHNITTAGESGSAMYMIISGAVQKEHGAETITLAHGDSFGEELLFGLTEKYEYTTTPIGSVVVHMYMIVEEEFQDCFRMMPDVLLHMKQNFLSMN